MPEQHGRAEDHRRGIGLILTLEVFADVSAPRLEESVLAAKVAAWDDTRSTDQCCRMRSESRAGMVD